MYINKELKHSKHLFHPNAIKNTNGLRIHLATMVDSTYVGAIVVTKELSTTYQGRLIRITHEECKAGVLKNLSIEDVAKG